MPLIYLSYAFSLWMMIDAFQRGAELWWKVVIFMPFGEVAYFLVVKLKDFTGDSDRYISRCRSCQYFMNLDEKSGVHCKVSGRKEILSPSRANHCLKHKKSSWV